MTRRPVLALCSGLLLALAACSDERPYIAVSGGGFIFNYRLAEATAGIVAEAARPLPEGGVVEARFEDPAGGAPIVEAKRITDERRRFSFVTPPLTGIKADTDYLVVVRVLDAEGHELQRIEKTLRSELDQSVLPPVPLTIGPGYARNPAAQD